MLYKAKNGETYELNLIDTPGHVDFSYEVSRSLSACEGAILIIDAAQGVEAQTVANVHLAMKQNLAIIPVINKIDLPHANIPQARQQLEDILAIAGDSAILASAKEGIGINEILEAIIERIPAPNPTGVGITQALVFDSYFDTYKGVVIHVRVFAGELKPGMQVKLLHSSKSVEIKEVGSFNPKPYVREKLESGRDRLYHRQYQEPARRSGWATPSRTPGIRRRRLAGFKEIHPMVFSGIYPINTADYEHLKANLGKLQLNDSAFVYQAETSGCVGLRLPVRFSGSAPPGDRPGTASARVRDGHHRHLPERHLPGATHRRHRSNKWTIRPFSPRSLSSNPSRSRWSRPSLSVRTSTSGT